MKKKPTFFRILCCMAWIWASPSLAAAQALAFTQQSTSRQESFQASSVSLRDVLLRLKETYKVDLLFEEQLMENRSVPGNLVVPAATLEQNLDRLVQAAGLRYRKTKEKTYVILASKRKNHGDSPDSVRRPQNSGMAETGLRRGIPPVCRTRKSILSGSAERLPMKRATACRA